MRILLVEDEESLRVTLAANLELADHEVLEAGDGRTALEMLDRGAVDLVLSDVRMPILDGVGLIRQIRRAGRNLPVVVMTAYAAEEQLEAAIAEGAFAVLKKPFDIAQAIGVLARAVARPIVLVVDDDRAVAASIVATLGASGVQAEAVFSGEEALALVDAGRVDVCVTDLVMPGMDGATLAASLRAKHPAPAVVLISGHDTREAMRRISAAKVESCLKKPFQSSELLRTVARARSRPLGA